MSEIPSEEVTRRRALVAAAGHTGEVGTARDALADADPRVRATALGALARLGVLTDDEVRRGLADPEPKVRRRAAEVAVPLPAVDLVPALHDDDPAVVEAAAWACGERERADPGVVAALSSIATEHPEALTRESAVAALGAIGHPDGLAAILAATTDKPAIRRRAVLALAPFEGDEVDAAIERASTDRDWQVRQAAEDLGGPTDAM